MGVGTATTKNVASANRFGSVVASSEVPASTSFSTSRVTSTPRRRFSTRSPFKSKPMVPSCFFAKARAIGKPTYPSPMTAIRSFMAARCCKSCA
jgi:hypothetical protein